jgi:Carboxypeptidase regulatory-like domain/TonB-dependent Receptor Plug Domain
MRKTSGRISICLFLLLICGAVEALSQTTASIFGTVTDNSGAVVVAARIEATNIRTNEVRTTVTGGEGSYNLPELPVGLYRMRIECQGFKTENRDGIELSLNRNAMVNVQLAVGAVSEQVNVTGDAPLVEATTSEMGNVVDQKRVVDLPLNGRNTLSLVSLVPGAGALTTSNSQGFSTNTASINGQRPEDSNWLLDGGDNTSPLRNYGNNVPNPDAVQEFRVITSNYDAQYGRSVGGVINVITKSGSNEFHGSLFEFLRNRSLNARNFFQATTTPLVQNQFGGSFGGPIVRNKTFFFFSPQWYRQRTAAFQNSALVPTVAERNGDFSNVRTTIKEPPTGQPFPNNIIPSSRVSPIAQAYLNLAIPLPNAPQLGPNALVQSASQPSDETQYLFKVDQIFSEKHKLSASLFLDNNSQYQQFLNSVDWIKRKIEDNSQAASLNEYWVISPTMLNHFALTFTRSAANRLVTPDNVSMNDLGSKFSPLPQGPQLPPEIAVSGYLNVGSPIGGPKTADNYAANESFSWTRGRHEITFGGDAGVRKLMDWTASSNEGGLFQFDGSATGNPLADLMIGSVYSLNVVAQQYKTDSQWFFYGYAQDKIRVNKRLFLTLGMRYESNAPPVSPTNALVTYRPGMQSTCVPQAPIGLVFPCDPGISRATFNPDLNNWAPRVGIAYDVFGDGKTIVRTGYGIFYAFALFNSLQDPQTSTPFSFNETIYNTTLANPYGPAGGSPFPFLVNSQNLKFPTPIAYGYNGTAGYVDPNLRNGYVQQYNFTIQHQFGKDWLAEVAYVGNASRKLTGSRDTDAPIPSAAASIANLNQRRPLYPAFTQVSETSGFVNASYNALQARIEKRFSHGFTLLGSYTMSKSVDDDSTFGSDSHWADQNDIRLDYATGDYNQHQQFVVSGAWELPFFRNSKGISHQALGGWSANVIGSFYTGLPVNLLTGTDNNFDGVNSDRPNVVGPWQLGTSRPRAQLIQAWFNVRAFQPNLPGQLGDVGRNVLAGPGTKNLDLDFSKNIPITEHRQLQFRCDMFNAANWVNLGSPVATLNSPNFGKIQTAGNPRIFQLALKFLF